MSQSRDLYEVDVRERALDLAKAERILAEEYLLLMASGQYHTWQAQKMSEVRHGDVVRAAQAEYEISLARLRRA